MQIPACLCSILTYDSGMIEMTISDRPKLQCMLSKKEEYVSQTVCGGIVDIIYNALFSHTKMANINRLKKSLAWYRMIHMQLFPNNTNMHTSSHCSDRSRDTSNSLFSQFARRDKSQDHQTNPTFYYPCTIHHEDFHCCNLSYFEPGGSRWVWCECPGHEKAVSFIPCGSSFVLFETNYTDTPKHCCFS